MSRYETGIKGPQVNSGSIVGHVMHEPASGMLRLSPKESALSILSMEDVR